MPVASYHQGPHKIGPKQIMAPKRADLKYWYKECQKVIPDLPPWSDSFRLCAHVEFEVIHFRLPDVYDSTQDLYIARRRHLR